MSIQESMCKMANMVDNRLNELLSVCYPEKLYEAMAYSVFAGGKRIRPVMLIAACESIGGYSPDCIEFACAIEMIHVYSLIHDDLPAMDDDDYRRGIPSNHVAHGEAMAILAGDALLNKAYEVMSEECVKNFNIRTVTAMNIIAGAAGAKGMVGGQVVDILSENTGIDNQTLLYMYKNKTAALFQAALKAGCALGGGGKHEINKFDEAGYNIGMAFQIKDDILDFTGSVDVLGKPVKSDEKNNKSTFTSIHGMAKSAEELERYSGNAISILNELNLKSRFLVDLVKYLIDRQK